MHNNRFEQKVEQQMGDLKFTPSESVWQKVEQQIRERKRKRRFFFWWLPAILIGTGLSIWGISNQQNEKIQDTGFKVQELRDNGQEEKVQGTRDKVQDTRDKVEGTREKVQDSRDKVEGTREKIQDSREKAEGTRDKVQDSREKIQSTRVKPQVRNNTNTIAIVKQQKDKVAIVQEEPTTEKQTNSKPVVTNQPNEPTSSATIVSPMPEIKIAQTVVPEKIVTESTNEPVQPIVNKQDSTKEQQSAIATNAKKQASTKKWMINLVVRGGFSHMSPFVENTNKSNLLYSSPSTSVGGGTSSLRDSSITKMGPSFSVGFEWKKPIGKRSFLSTGLDYGFYSSAHKTGQQINASAQVSTSITNSSFDRYNTAGTTSLYRDRYHLIELPVLYTLQLTKLEKRPIEWQGGMAYSVLIHSNAQFYSRSSSLYYYDQKLFQRSQFQVRTAFTIGLLKKENYPLQIGVEYQYNLSGQWKKALDLNQHLSFTGLRLSWRINK